MSAADIARNWNTIASIATLGTNRGGAAVEKLWLGDESAAPVGLSTPAPAASSTSAPAAPSTSAPAASSTSAPAASSTSAPAAPSMPAPSTLPQHARLRAAAFDAASPERSLLRTAAMSYLSQLSGGRIEAANLSPPDLAPSSQARVVSENAAWRLARMLAGDHRDLVPEWFSLAARAAAVLPPQWLPVVLNELHPHERAAAAPVLGPRAEWLAKRNPEWTSVAPATGLPIDRWNNGTLPERGAALAIMREQDPTGARILLERSWQTEPPDARAAFLETLLTTPGLSAADEPFLESALDDKRKDVRLAAVECLCTLPNSAHAKRNLARLQPLITLTEQGTGLLSRLKKRRLEITLPASIDKATVRDGINAKPPAQQKIGERAYWLMQMIAMAPPSHWGEHFKSEIDTLIAAALSTDYAVDLLLAFSNAAIRHHDAAWITALSLQLLAWYDHAENQGLAAQTTTALVAAAPASERDAILRKLLTASKGPQFSFLQGALAAADSEWSAETTRLACERLEQRVGLETADSVRPRDTFAHWGPRVEVATASRALLRILEHTGDKSPWRNALEALNDIIEFRVAMRQELST